MEVIINSEDRQELAAAIAKDKIVT